MRASRNMGLPRPACESVLPLETPLSAPEHISLAVFSGQVQQIELALLVDLELGEADRDRTEILGHGHKFAEWHELDR